MTVTSVPRGDDDESIEIPKPTATGFDAQTRNTTVPPAKRNKERTRESSDCTALRVTVVPESA